MRFQKYKPSQEAIQKWIADCEAFKTEINNLAKEYDLNIIINEKCNSVYFEFKNESYRISTHHSQLAEITGTNGSGYSLPQNNRVTNSKKNIINIIKKIVN